MNARTLSLIHREPPIRWPNVIQAMQDAGFSLRQIGGALGVAHSTVQTWQRGSVPNYEDGKALLALMEIVRPYITQAVRIA